MKREDRFVWIETYIRDRQRRSVDLLNRDFVDAYINKFDAPCKVMFYGADKCKQLGRDLGDMYRAGRLRRVRTPIHGMGGMGFPTWVWSYKLPDPAAPCEHLRSEWNPEWNGSRCLDCGAQVLVNETRTCGDCHHHRALFSGSICNKHFMAVNPGMKVTYKVSVGTCWTEKKS